MKRGERSKKTRACEEARVARRGRAPVADQNVIAKIKESVASDARDATRLDTRVLPRFAAVGDRQREKEAILRALLGRKPFWGLVLLINEPLESACTFLRFVRRE